MLKQWAEEDDLETSTREYALLEENLRLWPVRFGELDLGDISGEDAP